MLIMPTPIDGAVTALAALRAAGHQLTVITARTQRLRAGAAVRRPVQRWREPPAHPAVRWLGSGGGRNHGLACPASRRLKRSTPCRYQPVGLRRFTSQGPTHTISVRDSRRRALRTLASVRVGLAHGELDQGDNCQHLGRRYLKCELLVAYDHTNSPASPHAETSGASPCCEHHCPPSATASGRAASVAGRGAVHLMRRTVSVAVWADLPARWFT
jgi:hypothetical protein